MEVLSVHPHVSSPKILNNFRLNLKLAFYTKIRLNSSISVRMGKINPIDGKLVYFFIEAQTNS
jgi:hypothetical protein